MGHDEQNKCLRLYWDLIFTFNEKEVPVCKGVVVSLNTPEGIKGHFEEYFPFEDLYREFLDQEETYHFGIFFCNKLGADYYQTSTHMDELADLNDDLKYEMEEYEAREEELRQLDDSRDQMYEKALQYPFYFVN